MTQHEFDTWKAHTRMSLHRYIIDPIHDGKDGRDCLIHRGGEDGVYLRFEHSGYFETGTYQGAIPDIGEATFTRTFSKQFGSADVAFARVSEQLGVSFLLDLVSR